MSLLKENASRTAMEIGGLTGLNEDMEPQIQKIASLTGTQPQAIKQFVFAQELNITKLLKFIEKGKLKDRMDFVTALVGNPGNPIQKKMIKMFQESVNEEIGAPVSKTKTVNAKLASGADMGARPASALGMIGTVNIGGKKYQVKAFQGSTSPVYTLIGHNSFNKNTGMPFWQNFMKKLQELNGGKKVMFTPARDVKLNESVNESQDHEVKMAQNSLDSIIKYATELKQKMGEMEKDIPAWIQSYITMAGEYISQASSNYHEYGSGMNEGKLNEMDRQLNVKVNKMLERELGDLRKGGPNHQFAIMYILQGALTDANFHSTSRKVPSLFPRAKYEGDPMAEKDLIQMYEYEIGPNIAALAKWDGKDIVDAIGFYVSMTIGRPMGEKIEKLVEGKK